MENKTTIVNEAPASSETNLSLQDIAAALQGLNAQQLVDLLNVGQQELANKTVSPKDVEVGQIIKCALEKMATNKEYRYFWNTAKYQDGINNMIKTFCVLADAKKTDQMIHTPAGNYKVSDYDIPNIEWITKFVNFSHCVYVSPVQLTNCDWLDISERPNNWTALPGEVLSPVGLREICAKPAEQNNKWSSLTPVSKNPVSIQTLNGVYDSKGEFHVWSRTADVHYGQHLGIVCDAVIPFMDNIKAVATLDALIDVLCGTSNDKNANQRNNSEDQETSSN